MQHRVAIWAHWFEICDRVYAIASAERRQLHEVVDIDEVMSDLAVLLLHRYVAHRAAIAPVMEAGFSGLRITLVTIDLDPSNTAFDEVS